jgi:DNA repair exonuclease SbcCD nuclease subunit
MFRFVHASDLHLGKRFGSFDDPDLRGRLRDARHGAIGRLAQVARREGAGVVLLAGDTFDTETPSPTVLRQALAAMRDEAGLRWVLLPGNHDSLQAEQLWDAVRRDPPPNVVLALEPEPIRLATGVVVLPAPCTTRRPGRDLTAWMDDAATEEGELRIGLAHGAVQSFSERGAGADIIAPGRAGRAALDYLALGDWHGLLSIGGRTWYSGAPEPDSFKHGEPGRALVVSLAGHGAEPDVHPVETGAFVWPRVELALTPGDDCASRLAATLPGARRRQTVLHLTLSGRAGLAERLALVSAIEAAAPEFAHLHLDQGGLLTECAVEDLDSIEPNGALRVAAEALLAESRDEHLAADGRAIASAALSRLASYCRQVPR